jgi:hypothetical protein
MSDASQTRVTLVVPVKPGRIFDLLATPYRLPEIDPSGTILSDDNASPVTAAGQSFTMNMVANGGPEPVSYQAKHEVDVFEHNRAIGWSVVPVDGDADGWSWRFDLTPLDGKRTEVALTYDWSQIAPDNAARYGIPDHDAVDLEACLTRLALAAKK